MILLLYYDIINLNIKPSTNDRGEKTMQAIKSTIAKNIASLRAKAGLTQIELAQKLNYSDKAVSKWERGESIPDVSVLVKIAELFDVSLDYLILDKTNDAPESKKSADAKASLNNRIIITALSLLLVWIISLLALVINFEMKSTVGIWLNFIYAVPVSLIVWLVFNSIWFNRRRNFLIISLLMWSVIGAVYLSFFIFGTNLPLIFLLGIPGQIAIFLWSKFKL